MFSIILLQIALKTISNCIQPKCLSIALSVSDPNKTATFKFIFVIYGFTIQSVRSSLERLSVKIIFDKVSNSTQVILKLIAGCR